MAKCIHHWYLGSSHKGVIHATCLKCGEKKDYHPIVISPFKSHRSRKAAIQAKPQAA